VLTSPHIHMKSQNRRRLRWVVVAVGLYAAIGFFALPPLIKWQLEKRLPAEIGRPVSIGRVYVNPFALSFALERVSIRTPDGSESALGWQKLYVNFDAIASIGREWVLSDVSLAGLQGVVGVKPDGSLNFSDVLEHVKERHATPASDEPGRPWRIHRLDVVQAGLEFTDESQATPFHTTVGPANFTVIDLRTAGVSRAPGRFEAVSESGEKLTWIGSLTAVPLTSTGEIRVENFSLPKYAPYLANFLKAQLESGRLALTASYELDLTPDHRRIALTDGSLKLQNLKLLDANDHTSLVDLATLEVNGLTGDALAPSGAVNAVRVEGGRIQVVRAADGTINLLGLVTQKPAAGGPATPATTSPPLEFSVKEVRVRDFEVAVRDLTGPRPAEFALSRMDASLDGFALKPGATMALDLRGEWSAGGTLHLGGNVSLDPLGADLQLDLAGVALAPLSPYLESGFAAKLARGAASTQGSLRVSLPENRSPDIQFSGGARLDDVSVTPAEANNELAALAELSVADVKLSTAPGLVASIGEVKLVRPVGHLRRDQEGKLNLPQPPGAAKTEAPSTPPVVADSGGSQPEITISRVLIDGGEVTFEDDSVQPPARFTVTQLGGALRNFSSLHPELGSIELRAKVNGGDVSATGRLNPLGQQPVADVVLTGEVIDLMPAGPYVAKYAGFALENGQLFLNSQARLDGDKLDLNNKVTLDHFTLGQPTPNPDAVKLPVKFGVALLKDSSGKIVLDLPVQGSLSDPQFSVGPVVSHAITSLLSKAATSPFSLLGAMFGGGGEELAQQEFLPGQTTLTETSLQRLQTVQRALTARPALQLRISGGFDPAADRRSLQATKFEDQLRERAGAPAAELTPEQRRAVVETWFVQAFANDAAPTAAVPLPPATSSAAATAPTKPEEHRGLVRRAWDLATLKGARNWWHDRKERAREEERAKEEAARAQAAAKADAEARTREAQSLAAGAPPTLAPEEMEARLLETIQVTDDELRALAEARAERVREQLLADGSIAAERLQITPLDPKSAAGGARVTLQLQ